MLDHDRLVGVMRPAVLDDDDLAAAPVMVPTVMMTAIAAHDDLLRHVTMTVATDLHLDVGLRHLRAGRRVRARDE